jgi:acetyltransferase
LELLEEILIRLAQLVTDFPEIEELDINPMILMGDQDLAVDARVIVKPSKVPSPHHLVISPYPNQYEATARTKGGLDLLIRPIKPEDAPLLVDLFHSLSERSVYYRFFSPLKSLPPEMLARFTQLDYDRDMALVAFDQTQLAEKMLGVARYVGHPSGESGEIAVAVGDAWHGKGVGATLLKRLLMIAKERGMASLGGPVLEENTDMLALAKKLGFSVSRLPGERAYEIKMDLKTMSTL